MKDQILKIIDAENLTPARFADEIGVQRSSISHLLSGRNKPSYDFILKILNRFSGINAEWLITGKGSMIKASELANNTQKDIFEQVNIESSENIIAPASDSIRNTTYTTEKSTNNQANQKPKFDQDDKAAKMTSLNVTNVNDIDFILVFYDDGTFKRFKERD